MCKNIYLKRYFGNKYIYIHFLLKTSESYFFSQAREVLSSIAEDQQYFPEAREAALVSLFTLPQNATMWQRIAMNTWRDYSSERRVPMFIHSFIKAVAESRNPHFLHKINIARHVLPLTKQFKLKSLYLRYWSSSDYSISQDLAYHVELVNAVRHSSDTPSVIKARFLAVLGGLKFPIFHSSIVGKSLKPETLRSVKEMFVGMMGPEFTKSLQYRQAVTYLENLDSEQFYHFTWFKDIEMFIPVTGDYIQELLHSEQSSLAKLFNKLLHNEPIHSLAYTNIVEEFEFIPSDIGVPITTEIFRPLFAYQEVNSTKTTKDPQWKKTKIEGKSNTKLVFGNDVAVKMLVPWTNETISVELHGETSFNMPLEFSAELDVRNNDVKVLDYSVQMMNQHQKPVSSYHIHAQPLIKNPIASQQNIFHLSLPVVLITLYNQINIFV